MTFSKRDRKAAPDNRQLLALAFADQCRRWSVHAGASDLSVQAAGQAAQNLILKIGEGHVCWPISEAMDTTFPERLRASGIVGASARDSRPLVLTEDGLLYLTRHFMAEDALAAALRARHQADEPPGKAARRMWQTLFARVAPGDEQALAVAMALFRQLLIVSGGPGTGKTTMVARLLACLLADAPESRVALAAPTGKAAARLWESLSARAGELPLDIAAFLPREAQTLHRLLGIAPQSGEPRYHAERPLPVDVLVIDEASMLDLDLALKVCEALPKKSRLILLGDKDQLQSVDVGAVFAAVSERMAFSADFRKRLSHWTGWTSEKLCFLSSAENEEPPFLEDAVIWLRKRYRFDEASSLGRLATALVEGDGGAAWACFSGLDLLHDESRDFSLLRKGFAAYQAALADWPGTRRMVEGERDRLLERLFEAFGAFRVLCVVRQGNAGVESINTRLERDFSGTFRSVWRTGLPFHGQPLLILKNDPENGLSNGDIGLALEDEEGLGIWFPGTRGVFRRLSPGRLPAWESAYAMTVHKSQGSEFDRAALILPEEDNPLLTRELVYTAVTRARKGVLLQGEKRLFLLAVGRPARREGRLAERLRVRDEVGSKTPG